METNNIISSSAYLLFYRRRTRTTSCRELAAKIETYVNEQAAILERQSEERSMSVPLLVSPPLDASSGTSSSDEIKEYVPFIGPGRPLGGMGDGYLKNGNPISNPFIGGASWAANVNKSRFATTTNSETSERPSIPQDTEDDTEPWDNNSD